MTSLCLSLLLIGYIVHVTNGYPTGVPDLACTAQDPVGHASSPQTTPSPYQVTVDPNMYGPGESVTVTISGIDGAADTPFKGFFLQARRTSGDTEKAIGRFADPPEGTQLLNCHENMDNAWLHSSPANKTAVTIEWIAPDRPEGALVFRATIVQGPKETYWKGVESESLTYNGPTVPTTTSRASGTQPITAFLVVSAWFLSVLLWQQN